MKTKSSKEAWELKREPYKWHLLPPFTIKFDRCQWWKGKSDAAGVRHVAPSAHVSVIIRKGDSMADESQNQNAPDNERTTNFGWVKMMRGEDFNELIEKSPLAFALAAVIAQRARFKPGVNLLNGLCQGEAFLGDHKAYGMSKQQYRTAKKRLEKWRFATFKPTSRGTTAKLINTRLFDVLNETAEKPANTRGNTQTTRSQHASNNKQECKNERT